MAKHSTLVGGSTAERFINCYGWQTLAAKLPPPPVSEYATIGSALHFVVEQVLEQDPDFDLYSIAGEEIEIEGEGTVEITDEMLANKIEPCVNWFDQVLDPDQFWLEQKLEFSGELHGAWGKGDVLYKTDNGVAGVVDWKFGDGVNVDARDNIQLLFYLGAAMDKFPDIFKDVVKYVCYIVQPTGTGIQQYRDTGEFSAFVSSAEFTLADVKKLKADLIYAKDQRYEGNLQTKDGRWCKFCPAMPICPTYRDRGKAALESIDPDVLKPMSTDLRDAYFEALKISKWVEAVKRVVVHEFNVGRTVPGIKKVISQNVREWIDEKYAADMLRRKGLRAGEIFTPRTLNSPAKIEKALGCKLDSLILRKPLLTTRPRGYSYVDEDDPRPAVEDEQHEAANALGDAMRNSLKQK